MDHPVGADLQEWIDKNELSELIAVLSSAMDRGDRDQIIACYTHDSYDDHGTFKGSGWEFADFVCRPGSMSSMHHLLGHSVFDVQGDEAWGETFFVFHGADRTAVASGHGRYVDYFRKDGGTWKLKYRRVVPETVPVGDDLGAYWSATRDRTDPSYDRRRGPRDAHPDVE